MPKLWPQHANLFHQVLCKTTPLPHPPLPSPPWLFNTPPCTLAIDGNLKFTRILEGEETAHRRVLHFTVMNCSSDRKLVETSTKLAESVHGPGLTGLAKPAEVSPSTHIQPALTPSNPGEPEPGGARARGGKAARGAGGHDQQGRRAGEQGAGAGGERGGGRHQGAEHGPGAGRGRKVRAHQC